MKKLNCVIFLNSLLLFSCKTAPKELEEKAIANPKSIVEVVNIKFGEIDDELVLSATTVYLKRNVVTATIPAFITSVKVKLGDAVNKGDVLFELESKERRALGDNASKLDTSLTNFGVVKIKAQGTGVISTLDKQQPGGYVLEGTQLCTIAESSDLAFQVNVPYEFAAFATEGRSCTITLPDNTMHKARFTKSLTSMNVLSQTQTILAKANENLLLPENMIVKVVIIKGATGNKQILPKESVLSDEMMKEFWVMKIINDSTAIKVPVTVGNKNTINSEILYPPFNPNDKIISSGNYGLPDTALVKIVGGK
jgi:hypothetical protein